MTLLTEFLPGFDILYSDIILTDVCFALCITGLKSSGSLSRASRCSPDVWGTTYCPLPLPTNADYLTEQCSWNHNFCVLMQTASDQVSHLSLVFRHLMTGGGVTEARSIYGVLFNNTEFCRSIRQHSRSAKIGMSRSTSVHIRGKCGATQNSRVRIPSTVQASSVLPVLSRSWERA